MTAIGALAGVGRDVTGGENGFDPRRHEPHGSRQGDVLWSQVGPDAEKPDSVPLTARLKGCVGGHLNHQIRDHVGDGYLPAAEGTATDLSRPRMVRSRHLGEDSRQHICLLAGERCAAAHDPQARPSAV